MNYTAHPFADMFPMMGDAELKQLADDIRQNGQREPICAVGRELLDGRNRYRACQMAGVKPKVEQYAGDDLLGFVLSKNLHRRHLTESQRAMIAAKLANMKREDTLKQGPRFPNLENGDHPPVSIPKAAEMLNVGTSNIYKAKQVQRDGVPELVESVESGDVSLNAAELVSTLPAGEQAEAVGQGPDAVKAKAAEVKRAKQQKRPAPPAAKGPSRPAEFENKAKPKRLRGVGVIQANEALNVLHRIPADDPELEQAVNIITAWVNRQKGRMPRN